MTLRSRLETVPGAHPVKNGDMCNPYTICYTLERSDTSENTPKVLGTARKRSESGPNAL